MMKFILSIILFLSSFAGVAKAEVWTLDDILEATCRVRAGNGYGSGTCIYHEKNLYYILTNAHVVGNESTAYVEFFKTGRKTLPLPSNVIYRRLSDESGLDFAIVTVPEKYFGKYPPKIAKLASKSSKAIGNYIKSAGCPSAHWPSAWEGYILSQDEGRILFYPPPVGGQSGSGLYINVENDKGYDTVLKGVVTWRIGTNLERMDEKGYESAQGGAVLIDNFIAAMNGEVKELNIDTENYIPVVYTGLPIPADWKGPYAQGKSGLYYAIYEKDGYFRVNLKPTDSIIKWGVQCPGGMCPIAPPMDTPPRLLPIPDRNNDDVPDNPYDNLPDFSNQEPKPQPTPEPKEDNSGKIAELEARVQDLTTQLNNLQAEKSGLEEQLKDLQSKLDNAKKDLIASDSDKSVLQSQIDDIKLKLDKSNQDIMYYQQQLQTINSEKNTLNDNVKEQVEKTSYLQLLTSGSVLTNLGAFAIIAYLIRKIIAAKPLTKVEEVLDPIEDKIQKSLEKFLPSDMLQSLRNKVESAEAEQINAIKKMAEALADSYEKKNLTVDKLDDRVAGLNVEIQENSQKTVDSLDEKLEGLRKALTGQNTTVVPTTEPKTEPKTEQKTEPTVENIEKSILPELPTTVTNYNTISNKITIKESPGLRHFRELMKIKVRDGESPEYYAVLGYLYKEAVQEMKQGNLWYKDQSKLLGQEKTAKLIDDWVVNQLAIRHQSGQFTNVQGTELEAMQGFLYKEAVDRLRNGNFDSLNAQETAIAIENWVNKQYVRRLGINTGE